MEAVGRAARILSLIAVLTCLVLSATPSQAESQHLSWQFYVDCYANGGDVNHADTSDNLTVKFYNDGEEITASTANTAWDRGCGEFADMSYAVDYNDYQTVDEVRIYTDGDDALWMDQVELWTNDGGHSDELYHWGSDNTQGWCLSTDWDDWEGDWSNNVPSEHCRSCYRFLVSDLDSGYSCPDVHDDEN